MSQSRPAAAVNSTLTCDVNRPALVLVVVVAVRCVSAAVVDVVDVIAMRDRHMATAIAMNMVVGRMHLMLAGGLAFVVVIVVPSMEVTVV